MKQNGIRPGTSPASTYTRSFNYNDVGNVTQRTDQNGDITTYSYDDLHQLTGRSYTVGGSSPTYPTTQGPDSFTYDRAGRMLTGVRDYASPNPDVTLEFTRDTAGRVTGLQQDSYTTTYTYTVTSSVNRREITYPSSKLIREDLDDRNRVTSIANMVSGSPSPTLATNTYDLANRQTQRDFGNGMRGLWTWNDAGRVSQIEHLKVSGPVTEAKIAYGRDDVGNPLYRQDLHTNTHSEVYDYDDANRLIEFERGEFSPETTSISSQTSDNNLTQRQAWTLDLLGNWDANEVETTSGTITEPRTNNDANEYATIDYDGSGGASAVTIVHDHNGNLKDDGTYLYDYDIENRMTRVRLKSSSATIATYFYDALGRRVRKVVSNLGSGSDGTFELVNSPEWQLLEWHRTAGTGVVADVVYVHGGQSAYIDDHVAYWIDSDWAYYHTDAQFNTVAVSGNSAVISERYVLDPYGKPVAYAANWTSPHTPAAYLFLHQGLLWDAETAKYQNRYREFFPGMGRFGQRDPIAYAEFGSTEVLFELGWDPAKGSYQNRHWEYVAGLQLLGRADPVTYADGTGAYSYVQAKPVSALDPSGLLVLPCGADDPALGCNCACPVWSDSVSVGPIPANVECNSLGVVAALEAAAAANATGSCSGHCYSADCSQGASCVEGAPQVTLIGAITERNTINGHTCRVRATAQKTCICPI